jgi:hypothetical protein
MLDELAAARASYDCPITVSAPRRNAREYFLNPLHMENEHAR